MNEKDQNERHSPKLSEESVRKEYIEKTKDTGPRILVRTAMPYIVDKDCALDLGAGALNDARYLIAEGFSSVTAVDKFDHAKEIGNSLPKEHFTFVVSAMENYDFPENTYDLVSAQFALPFIAPEKIESVLEKIKASLKKDGIFTGHFFGDRDEWVDSDIMNFHSAVNAKAEHSGLEIISFEEKEYDGGLADGGTKHWHVFDFIARK